MCADASNLQSRALRLPILGTPVPPPPAGRNSCHSPPARSANFAGDLTPVPKNWQLERRFASRGGTRHARKAAGARSPANRAWMSRSISTEPARGFECAPSCQAIELPYQRTSLRVVRRSVSVDTNRVSDTIENLKTCEISIGSASLCPPCSCSAALLRRSWRLVSGDDQRSARGVFSWSAVRCQRSASSGRKSFRRSTYFVGETQRSSLEGTGPRPAGGFDPSSTPLTAVAGPPRIPTLARAACALQRFSERKVHNWPWDWRTRRRDNERVRFELR